MLEIVSVAVPGFVTVMAMPEVTEPWKRVKPICGGETEIPGVPVPGGGAVPCQLCPPFVLLKTPAPKVAVYTVDGLAGSITRRRIRKLGRPAMIALQVCPPSVLFMIPAPKVPA